ncbi:hypothetical protein PVAP13_3KG457501 [Panicum virgatum]|uniref:Uncharacterized protein n=1 Tax=Panicum virgatum TaxID=38727 RepID=A0A8T0V7K4_PANVG|nr:hypothetical protein PVAP13_3KG457501 [Panicum virgatum]
MGPLSDRICVRIFRTDENTTAASLNDVRAPLIRFFNQSSACSSGAARSGAEGRRVRQQSATREKRCGREEEDGRREGQGGARPMRGRGTPARGRSSSSEARQGGGAAARSRGGAAAQRDEEARAASGTPGGGSGDRARAAWREQGRERRPGGEQGTARDPSSLVGACGARQLRHGAMAPRARGPVGSQQRRHPLLPPRAELVRRPSSGSLRRWRTPARRLKKNLTSGARTFWGAEPLLLPFWPSPTGIPRLLCKQHLCPLPHLRPHEPSFGRNQHCRYLAAIDAGRAPPVPLLTTLTLKKTETTGALSSSTARSLTAHATEPPPLHARCRPQPRGHAHRRPSASLGGHGPPFPAAG